jgi:superfamily II DNA/RNA helicase
VRRRSDAEWLYRALLREGHPVDRIHSDLSQKERLASLDGFREGQHRIMIATDIASRGLDVPGIQHIINYDLPETVEDYVHRAGRTARGNATGPGVVDRQLDGEGEDPRHRGGNHPVAPALHHTGRRALRRARRRRPLLQAHPQSPLVTRR